MAKSGFIYGNAPTVNSTAEILKKYNKMNGKSYWNTAYSEINKAYNNGLYQLDNAMADNMARQNYATMQAKNTAAQMNLGSGDLVRYNTYYDNALEQAYNSYKSSYNDAVGELNTSIGKAYDAVNTELAAQSQNTANFTNSTYDFLSSMASDIDSPLYENGNIGWQYDWLFKTTENPATGYRDLLDRDSLNNMLYDENGTLNRRGQMFYDMMFNNEFIRKDDVKGEYGMRYTDYLAENNPELLEWATSVNQYDDSGMNNAQYVKKQLMGLEEDTFRMANYMDAVPKTERLKYFNYLTDEEKANYFDTLPESEQVDLYKQLDEDVKNSLVPLRKIASIVNKYDDNIKPTNGGLGLDVSFIATATDDDLANALARDDVAIRYGLTKEQYANRIKSGNDPYYSNILSNSQFLRTVAQDIEKGNISEGEIIALDPSNRGDRKYVMVVDGKLVSITAKDGSDFDAVTQNDYNEFMSFKKVADVDYKTYAKSYLPENEYNKYNIPRGVEQAKKINDKVYYYEPNKGWVEATRKR